ncbi:helix-turn-helix transcriptional regulator [Paludibacterium sp.]|nr:helix-turn-helix transcriptional regulator [Paludibacterium sp.]
MDVARRPDLTDFSRLASLLSDPGRARMLTELMTGLALTPTELARCSGLSPSSASNHLTMLLQNGVLEVIQQGRNRYYRLASSAVAEAIQALSHAAAAMDERRGHFTPTTPPSLRKARSCYRHLGGRLGVGLFDAMLQSQYLVMDSDQRVALTEEGVQWLDKALGMREQLTAPARGALFKPCLDQSERRFHASGPGAERMFDTMVALGWLKLSDGREVRLTTLGYERLCGAFPAARATWQGCLAP